MRFEDKATLNILARTSSSVFLLISSVIMVRYLSKEDYGTYLQVMLVLNTIIMLAFVGLPHSVYYYYPQVKDKRHLVKQTLWLGTAISAVAAAVVFVLRIPLAHWLNNPDLAYFGVFMALLILCQGPVAFRDPILLSQNALILNSVATLLTCLISYLPLFVALFLGVGLKGLMFVFLGSNVVNLLVFLAMVRSLLRTTEGQPATAELTDVKRPRVSLREQVRYSIPLGLSSYIGILGKQLDKYLISILFMPAQFAVFSRGAMEVPLIGNVTYTLNDMTMPRYVAAFHRGDIPEFLRLMHQNIDKIAKLNLGVFAFLFFEGGLLMEVLYTREYLDATPIFQAYLFLLFLAVTVYGMIPRVTGRTSQLTVATTLSVFLNLACSLALIPYIGPLGAAIGTVIGSFGYMVYLLFRATRSLGVSWRQIMPWGMLGRILSAAFVSLMPLWGLHAGLAHFGIPGNLWVLGLAFAVYAYFYLAVMNLLGLLPQEDRDFLRRWFRFNLFAYLPKTKPSGI